MHPRSFIALSLIAVATLSTSGCSRLVRSSLRASRGSSGNSSNQVKPEELTFSFTAPGAKANKMLDGYRTQWAQYVEKYDAAGLNGSAQIVAVFDGINNAHWSEKPRAEDCQRPLGVAIGDLLAREAGVNWVMANGTTLCLGSPNGKVLVGSVDVAERWLSTKSQNMNDLIEEVRKAVRETTGMPVEIGTKPDVDESDEEMI